MKQPDPYIKGRMADVISYEGKDIPFLQTLVKLLMLNGRSMIYQESGQILFSGCSKATAAKRMMESFGVCQAFAKHYPRKIRAQLAKLFALLAGSFQIPSIVRLIRRFARAVARRRLAFSQYLYKIISYMIPRVRKTKP